MVDLPGKKLVIMKAHTGTRVNYPEGSDTYLVELHGTGIHLRFLMPWFSNLERLEKIVLGK